MTEYPPRDDRLRHLIAQEINPHVPSWKLAFFIADGILTSRTVRAELKRVAEVHAAGEHCGDRNCEHCWNATTAAPAVPAGPVSSPPPDQTAARDRIAEALLDHLSRTADIRPGRDGALAFMPEVTDEERMRITDAVLAVLPPPADRAAVLLWAADFAEQLMDERYGPDCSYGIGGLDVARELRRLAAKAPQPASVGPSARAGLRDEIADALEAADYRPDMRRGDLADAIMPVFYRAWPWLRAEAEDKHTAEAPQPEDDAQTCVHCGKAILRISGTLATWWVHDPGGTAACFPQQAATSPRATPQPAAEEPRS